MKRLTMMFTVALLAGTVLSAPASAHHRPGHETGGRQATTTSDADGDGVDDETDNCPDAYNPGQVDSDGDGVGDACQEAGASDADGDGVEDPSDNCPGTHNPDQSDLDGDGTGDACEPLPRPCIGYSWPPTLICYS